MKSKKIIYSSSLILWLLSTAYFLYKYALDAGYWKNPLLVSLLFFAVAAITNKGLNKVLVGMALFYIGFGVWFIISLLLSMGNVLSVN